MKLLNRLFFCASVILTISNSQALSQDWILSNVINGTTVEPKYSTIDSQNNLYILTSFSDTITYPFFIVSYGYRDLLLYKIDPSGNLLWYKRVGSSSSEVAGGISLDDNDNCYISGTFYANCYFSSTDSLINTGIGDIFLAKYDSDGNLLWDSRVGSATKLQSSTDLKLDDNNHLLLTGFFKDSLIIGNNDVDKDTLLGNSYVSNFIAQFDLDGNHLWSNRYLSSTNLTRIQRIGNSDNGYYFGGYFQGDLYLDIDTISSYVSNTYDAFIYKTDLNGDGQWVRQISGSGTENFKTLTTDENDNVYVLGNYNSPEIYVDSTATLTNTYTGNSGGYDTYIGKYNRSGILQWFLRKGSTAKDIYNDFVIRENLIYATGYFANEIIFNQDTLRTDDPLNEDAFLVAFNEIGDPINAVSIVGTGNYNDAGTVVNMDDASRAYVAGYYKSQQIQIGDDIYTSDNVNASDLFFAIYEHPFTAVITDESHVSCNGLADGMLEVTTYFGKAPYTYEWSHDATLNDAVAEDLAAGFYSVTVTDDNGKTAYVSATVSEPDPIVVSDTTITHVACYNNNDGAIGITVTGGTAASNYSFYWTSAGGSGLDPTEQNQSGLTKGTYNVVIEDDNLCSINESYVVSQPDKITYTGSVVTDITIPPGGNGAIDLAVSGGTSPYDYAWTGPSDYSATTEDISALSTAGVYHIELTDDNGCTSDTSFTVSDSYTMIAQVTSKTDVTCYGYNDGTATVTVTNGQAPFTYNWNDIGDIATATRSGMAPGHYIVTVTDDLSNTAVDSVDILGPSAALTLLLDYEDLSCYQDNSGWIDLEVSGGTLPYSYDWSNGSTEEDLVNLNSGLYSVEVTDGNGCKAQDDVTLDEPDPIAVNINLSGENYCYGDQLVSATANVTGGFGSYEYLWNDPGTQVTKTAADLGADTYTVRVTDENGCKKSASVEVTEPNDLTTQNVEYDEPSCPGDTDGTIIPTIAGGTGSYDYVWSNSVYQRINSNIAAGTYTLTITDANNCNYEDEFILTEPDSVKITSITTTDPSCSNNDGVIEISAEGGSGIFEYSVDNGVNYASQSGISTLSEGEYTVVVRDDNLCESETYPASLVRPEGCEMIIYDAFSPNGDEYNEVWHIGNIDNYPQCKVQIYNTWGVMVFSSNGYDEPWNGTYNGKELPSGTYYYIIDLGDGSGTLTGPVSIVK